MSTIIITNLLTNMVVLTLRNTIPTNTPAFHDYAYHEMFTHASNMVVAWKIDLPRPITTNAVTEFRPDAHPAGIGGSIVFDGRFSFSWLYGGLPSFNDQQYSCLRTQTSDVRANDAVLKEWMQATNLLTLQSAQELAEGAMKSIGLPLDRLSFSEPKEANQLKYEWTDGKKYPLPYYQFYYKTEKAACTIDVSGIIGKVAYFSFTDFTASYLWFSKRTNYFEMLGLPHNPVFVKKRFTAPGTPREYEILGPSR